MGDVTVLTERRMCSGSEPGRGRGWAGGWAEETAPRLVAGKPPEHSTRSVQEHHWPTSKEEFMAACIMSREQRILIQKRKNKTANCERKKNKKLTNRL